MNFYKQVEAQPYTNMQIISHYYVEELNFGIKNPTLLIEAQFPSLTAATGFSQSTPLIHLLLNRF